MSAEEHEAILQRMAASLEDAMTVARHTLAADDAIELVELAALAVCGIHVVRWCPPGLSRPICPHCGRGDHWYQYVASGCVRCLCEIAP